MPVRMKLLGLACVIAAVAVPVAAASRHHSACSTYTVRTLLSGQGWLESLAFDGRGGLTISALTQGRILRLTRRGHLTTLLDHVSAPGGEIVRGRSLYFTTGDIVPPAANGTIDRLDMRTGSHTTWARGLAMPNGLAFLPDGDAVVTRDIETGVPATDVTLVPAHNRRHPRTNWIRIPDANGITVDPSGRWLYVDRSFTTDAIVDRVAIDRPRRVQGITRLGAGVIADDMSIDAAGRLYIAGFGTGRIYRLDPRAHASCAIARGMINPTAVIFGGRGWPTDDLFVTSASGYVYELKPR